MVTGKISREKLREALAPASATIEQVLKAMDNEVAIIVDNLGCLAGLVTDGDLRRAFLNGATMQTTVAEIMTRNPITIREDNEFSSAEILAFMLERQIRHLPVINEEKIPVGLELLRDQYSDDDLTGAVLMAGGKGTRLHPLTIDTPKPLLPIGDSTIIDNVIDGLKACGVNNIAVSVNYLGEKIKEHFRCKDDEDSIRFLEEKKELGTAGALSLINPRPTHAFIVMNADLLTEVDYKAFVRFHKDSGNALSVCVRKIEETVPFGVVSLDENNRNITEITEKPVNSYLVNAGIYMLEPAIVDLVPKNRFYDMVSLIRSAIRQGYKVGAFPILEYWRDIGQHQEMAKAAEEWVLRKKNETENKTGVMNYV